MNIEKSIANSIKVKELILTSPEIIASIGHTIDSMVACFKSGGRVLFCGNGGSAADAQHLSSELSGRFIFDRPPLDAEALHVNTSYITAVANDNSFDEVYARILKAKGRQGDVLVAISTSGKSRNIVNALKKAKSIGMTTVGLTGQEANNMSGLCDHLICVPSVSVPRIQESHILIGHIICESVEMRMFNK